MTLAIATATYNSHSLGDVITPENEVRQLTSVFMWQNQKKILFEKNPASIRYSGGRDNTFTLQFRKNPGGGVTDVVAYLSWAADLAVSLTPLVGSTAGAALVLSLGGSTFTMQNVFITRLETVYVNPFLVELIATFERGF